jgi:hypothetical protein
VLSVSNEFDASYWEVATDRGQREFVVQNVAENAQLQKHHQMQAAAIDLFCAGGIRPLLA